MAIEADAQAHAALPGGRRETRDDARIAKRAIPRRAARYTGRRGPKALEQDRVNGPSSLAAGIQARSAPRPRLSMELWAQLKNEDFSLVDDTRLYAELAPLRLWEMNKHYNFIGGRGLRRRGCSPPAAVGAALANRKFGRLSVNIQGDGDFMYCPRGRCGRPRGSQDSTAHYHAHDNRAYNQRGHAGFTRMKLESDKRPIDHAAPHRNGHYRSEHRLRQQVMAQGMGVEGEGPITDPKGSGPAIARGIAAAIKRGSPYLH